MALAFDTGYPLNIREQNGCLLRVWRITGTAVALADELEFSDLGEAPVLLTEWIWDSSGTVTYQPTWGTATGITNIPRVPALGAANPWNTGVALDLPVTGSAFWRPTPNAAGTNLVAYIKMQIPRP